MRINLSKSGVSTSLGRQATVNIRGERVRETVGLRGTGISYSQQQQRARSGNSVGLLILIVALAIMSWWFL